MDARTGRLWNWGGELSVRGWAHGQPPNRQSHDFWEAAAHGPIICREAHPIPKEKLRLPRLTLLLPGEYHLRLALNS
jgi:hypothetical protein